jgi:predicted Zn-dependent protease
MRSFFLLTLLLLASISNSHSQEYLLKNGRRFPASAVKISGMNCTATVAGEGGIETVVFTMKDISQATFAPVPDMAKARDLIVQKKFDEAFTVTDVILKATVQFKPLPGNPWVEALLLQLDALEGKKKKSSDSSQAAALISLTPDENELVTKMISIVDSEHTPAGIEKMKSLAKETNIGYIQARAQLRIADVQADFGNLEQAAKEYLCVPIFNATDSFLSFRATMSAANCLFQIKRGEDAIKILELYLTDNPNTKYKTMIETEKLRFKTPTKDDAGANKGAAAADKTPAKDDAEAKKESPKEEPVEKKEEAAKEDSKPDKTVDKTETNK